MAGYLFALDSLDSLELYAIHGVYGTKVTRSGNFWRPDNLFTIGDYLTMRPGDLVFFFHRRKIYGIGSLIAFTQLPVALCNYPDSYLPGVAWDPEQLLDQ